MDFKKKFDIVQKLWNVFPIVCINRNKRGPILSIMHTYM
jgi:hypothetical protein